MTEDEHFMVEGALQAGFRITDDDGVEFACTEAQIVALVSPIVTKFRNRNAALARYLKSEAAAIKSGAGLAVSAEATDFAAQRLRAIAGNLLAGLHLPDPEPQSESEAA